MRQLVRERSPSVAEFDALSRRYGALSERAQFQRLPWLDFVDVGLGEPPLGPIPLVLGTAFTTPDGLVHQITEVEGGNDWELQWLRGGEWAPRLRWRRADGPRFDHHAPSCGDFYAETERVVSPHHQ